MLTLQRAGDVTEWAGQPGEPGNLVAEYRYDGLNRRIGKTVPAGEGERVTEYFYNESWQLLEARTAEGEDESATHYVWDLSYIDAPNTPALPEAPCCRSLPAHRHRHLSRQVRRR